MKDVSISKLVAENVQEAALFIDVMNSGEAAFVPSLAADRASIAGHLRTLLQLEEVPSPRVLRLYEGQGRICGFLGAAPRDPAMQSGSNFESPAPQLVLQGPLLSIGDWAGHADALFRSLIGEISKMAENGGYAKHLELEFYPANRNIRRFAERHGFTIVPAGGDRFCTARAAIAP
ncbi:MAG: hypothetical protein ACOCRN_02675 [Spirochaetia bacterium]